MSSHTDSWSATSPFSLRYLHVGGAPRVQALGRVRLKLDRVRPGLRGDLDQTQRRRQVAVVIGAGLGDDVAGVPGTDRAVADQELGIAVDPSRHFSVPSPPRE